MKGCVGVISQPCEIVQVAKFSYLHNFNSATKAPPSATPAKKRTKIHENRHMKDRKITKKTKVKIKKLCKTTNETESNKQNINKILGWPINFCKDHTYTG